MSRFDPTIDELRASLLWHAAITTELQRRIIEASRLARGMSAYPILLALGGPVDVKPHAEASDGGAA